MKYFSKIQNKMFSYKNTLEKAPDDFIFIKTFPFYFFHFI